MNQVTNNQNTGSQRIEGQSGGNAAIRTRRGTEPPLRIVKRSELTGRQIILLRLLAVLLALAAGGLFILCLGYNPFTVYATILSGAMRSPMAIQATVKIVVPLLIASLGVTLAFKMRFWNIGAEGQFLMGAVFAGYFAFFLYDRMPRPVLIPVMLAAGMAGGGIYGMIPAFFKAKLGTNETLFTLMLNYMALALVQYLQNGPWKAPQSQFPKMPMLDDRARLSKILGVHWGWIMALVLVVLFYVYLTRTKQGYEIAVTGDSIHTARYAGIPVNLVIIRTMFLSGALAGLAAVFQVAGSDYTITEGTAGGVGFTAITAAWMAKLNPFGMLAASLFIAILERGSNKIQTTFKIPSSASEVLTGMILFFMLGCEFFMNYRLVNSRRRRENP